MQNLPIVWFSDIFCIASLPRQKRTSDQKIITQKYIICSTAVHVFLKKHLSYVR